jgi:glycosyltransferase involved in cell wall biosynthesis
VSASSDHDDVTVVIPCFNYGRFLEEAVDSVRSQDGGSPRILVVDDGSTDATTKSVLASLPADVEVLRQANAGPSAARNAGFRAASTPLLLALDADDMLPPGSLAAMKQGLERDPSAGFAYGVMEFFGAWSGKLTMPDWDPYGLLYRHTIGASALTRRELLDDVGGFDPEIRGFEDWELWLHALAEGWHGVRVPAVTVLYRQRGDATNFTSARREYRHWYRAIRTKHADLYGRRRELARESALGVIGRGVYRFYWGPRPVPAAVEQRVYNLLWGRRSA